MQHTHLRSATLRPGVRIGRVSDVEWYCAELHRHVLRRLGHRFDADDVAQRVVELLLANPTSLMQRYPEPARFAKAAGQHVAIGEDRRNRGQRGEGTRLRLADDGTLYAPRTVLSGEAPAASGVGSVFDGVTDGADAFDDRVLHRHEVLRTIEACTFNLSHEDRRLLYLVDGLGYTVVEVARAMRLTRETVSRRLSRIRRIVQQNRVVTYRSPDTDG